MGAVWRAGLADPASRRHRRSDPRSLRPRAERHQSGDHARGTGPHVARACRASDGARGAVRPVGGRVGFCRGAHRRRPARASSMRSACRRVPALPELARSGPGQRHTPRGTACVPVVEPPVVGAVAEAGLPAVVDSSAVTRVRRPRCPRPRTRRAHDGPHPVRRKPPKPLRHAGHSHGLAAECAIPRGRGDGEGGVPCALRAARARPSCVAREQRRLLLGRALLQRLSPAATRGRRA